MQTRVQPEPRAPAPSPEPEWSFIFGQFLGYFQRRNAIFVDFEERNTASVDVWVMFGSFSKKERVFSPITVASVQLAT